tara:strand:- start:1387 stop:2043 length:657 start_codon:yes stop_codon:yes gene_type:complete
MPTVRPSGAGDEAVGTAEKVDGGTVIHGGSNAAGVMTKNLSLADIADDFGEAHGSKIVANDGTGSATTDRAGVQTARGSGGGGTGTIGYNATATQWVVKGGNVSTTLNNAANTVLSQGDSDGNGMNGTRDNVTSNNKRKKIGTTDIDVYAQPSTTINGFVTRTGAGTNQNLVAPTDGSSAANDNEANTTRSVPGELVYMQGGKNPKQDDYKAKDTPES